MLLDELSSTCTLTHATFVRGCVDVSVVRQYRIMEFDERLFPPSMYWSAPPATVLHSAALWRDQNAAFEILGYAKIPIANADTKNDPTTTLFMFPVPSSP